MTQGRSNLFFKMTSPVVIKNIKLLFFDLIPFTYENWEKNHDYNLKPVQTDLKV